VLLWATDARSGCQFFVASCNPNSSLELASYACWVGVKDFEKKAATFKSLGGPVNFELKKVNSKTRVTRCYAMWNSIAIDFEKIFNLAEISAMLKFYLSFSNSEMLFHSVSEDRLWQLYQTFKYKLVNLYVRNGIQNTIKIFHLRRWIIANIYKI
jgi:hypothetical protein